MVGVLLEGARRRLVRESNDRIAHAWMSAALARSRKLPRLQSLMASPEPKRPQTWQEQLAIVKMLHAGLGGGR